MKSNLLAYPKLLFGVLLIEIEVSRGLSVRFFLFVVTVVIIMVIIVVVGVIISHGVSGEGVQRSV